MHRGAVTDTGTLLCHIDPARTRIVCGCSQYVTKLELPPTRAAAS
jgi:hypothetical protein